MIPLTRLQNLMEGCCRGDRQKFRDDRGGFTLIELMIVVAILGVLAGTAVVGVADLIEKARVAKALIETRSLSVGAVAYYNSVGFYPPDVDRGIDPGFVRPLPYNMATGQYPANISPTNNGHLPANWQAIVLANWGGPYVTRWPYINPWNGSYDYNYWPTGAVRNGANVPPGIYIGVQRGPLGAYNLEPRIERMFHDKKVDADGAINGEVQIILTPL